jgi:hypothetical protein
MVLGDVRIAREYGRHGQAHPEQTALRLEGDGSDENAAQSDDPPAASALLASGDCLASPAQLEFR